ncbi:MAG: tRNA (5-methylaminomethyl-2-thiouridine)(34)-methyltransferase MnmD, partial [Bacteroidota bacterium]
IYNPILKETYHSTHGAVTESKHVFLKEGMEYFLSKYPTLKKISIIEVGFGTGLNAMLTLARALEINIDIFYVTLEPFPISTKLIKALNYQSLFRKADWHYFETIHNTPWEAENKIAPHFTFVKSKTNLENFTTQSKFDLVYFDAFAPRKQPELWEVDALRHAVTPLKPLGVLVTYSAMGAFKRNLKALGMHIESIPGPPGKREMTRAIK